MVIRLLVSRAGNGFAQNCGDVIEVSDAEAIRMIEAGQAVPAVEVKQEFASKKPREKRVK